MAEIKQQSFLSQTIEFVGLLLLVFLIRTFIFGLYQVPTGSMENTMLVGERFFADKLSYWFREPKKGEIVALIQPSYRFSDNEYIELFQRYVWGPQNWTKRIIAGPRDYIRGTIENGQAVIYVNGKKIYEPYLNQYPLIVTYSRSKQGDIDLKSFDPSQPLNAQPFYRLQQEEIVTNLSGKPTYYYPSDVKRSSTPVEQRGNRFWDTSDEFSVQLKDDEYWLMGDNRRGSQDSRFFGPVRQKNIFARIMWCILSVDSNESWLLLDILKNPVAFWHKLRKNRSFKMLPSKPAEITQPQAETQGV